MAAKFELVASKADSAGIDPQTAFLLKSSENISEATVKKILVFDPQTDFEVKKLNSKFSENWLFKNVLAKEKNTNNQLASFEIRPKESLQMDTVYRVSLDDKEVTDREYGWAFQVKAPFQVINTFQSNHQSKAAGFLDVGFQEYKALIEQSLSRQRQIYSDKNEYRMEKQYIQLGITSHHLPVAVSLN